MLKSEFRIIALTLEHDIIVPIVLSNFSCEIVDSIRFEEEGEKSFYSREIEKSYIHPGNMSAHVDVGFSQQTSKECTSEVFRTLIPSCPHV